MASMQYHKPTQHTDDHHGHHPTQTKPKSDHSLTDKVKGMAHSAGKIFSNDHRENHAGHKDVHAHQNHHHGQVHAPGHKIGQTHKLAAGGGSKGTLALKKNEGHGNNCMPKLHEHLNMHKHKSKTTKKKSKGGKSSDSSSSDSDSDHDVRDKKD